MAFRSSTTVLLKLTDNKATTGYFNFEKYAGGIIDSASNAVVSWHVGSRGNAVQLRHTDGSLVSSTITANHAVPLPDELFGAGFVLGVLPGGAAEVTVRVSLKS